jgi:hypothetical protein
VRAREEKFQVQLTLFRAALAVAQNGPEKVKEFRDPAASGWVTYKTIPGGFAIQSQFRDEKGEPLTFYAGQVPRSERKK